MIDFLGRGFLDVVVDGVKKSADVGTSYFARFADPKKLSLPSIDLPNLGLKARADSLAERGSGLLKKLRNKISSTVKKYVKSSKTSTSTYSSSEGGGYTNKLANALSGLRAAFSSSLAKNTNLIPGSSGIPKPSTASVKKAVKIFFDNVKKLKDARLKWKESTPVKGYLKETYGPTFQKASKFNLKPSANLIGASNIKRQGGFTGLGVSHFRKSVRSDFKSFFPFHRWMS